jgi:DinB family protein
MRKLVVFFIAFVCCSFVSITGSLTDAERNFAVKHLIDTKAYLLNAVKGLSAAQLNFKASPERWSILECVEHITNTETLAFEGTMESVKNPINSEKRNEVKFTDEQLINAVLDRSVKVKAPEVIQPKGKYTTLESALDVFNAQRDKTIEYIKSTPDDLRNHLKPHPALGMLDGYQWLLLIGAHQKRHTLQIEEVKADKNFPKK